MLSRTIARTLLLRNQALIANNLKQSKRNGGHGTWSYRTPPPLPSKFSVYLATGMGGLCWYWILYHIASEPDHITGEFEYVNPSTWSDQELGIPPESAGSLKNN